MTPRRLRTLFTGGSFFEGPRWHEGAWWVSDFFSHRVTRVTPEGEGRVVTEVEQQPSGLGWLPDGSMVIVSMRDRRVLRLADGELSTLAEVGAYCGGQLNDCVVDSAGHVFVGDFGFDPDAGEDIATTSLKRVDPDGTVTVVADDLHGPNGIVVTPAGTLVVSEFWGNRLTAFDLDGDGSLSNRRVWAEFGPLPVGAQPLDRIPQIAVLPDGCTADADGHIWVADALRGRVVRVAPGGTIVEEISGPDGMGTYACMLGGHDGRTLLIAAAPDPIAATRAPLREAVLVTTRVDVPHAGLP